MIRLDDALVCSARNGSAQAFGELAAMCQDRLLTSISQIAESPEEAEDVVQDALLSAYVNVHHFRGHSSFYTWLFRIAVNQCSNRLRRRRWTRSLDTGLAGRSGEIAADVSPSLRLERLEQRQQLHDALRALPEDFRIVLELRELEQLQYSQIAELLQLSCGTVRSRLHRARRRLRQEIRRRVARSR